MHGGKYEELGKMCVKLELCETRRGERSQEVCMGHSHSWGWERPGLAFMERVLRTSSG